MTFIAHAIAEAPPATMPSAGLRGGRLAWAEQDGLGMWGTELASAVELGRADALAHHELVERMSAAQTCLPVRFGTVFATPDDSRQALARRRDDLRTALRRVDGKRELAVTLLWRRDDSGTATPLEPDAAGPGRRFMEERRARYAIRDWRRARAEALADRLLAELAVDRALVWHETCTSEDVAVSLAVLVPSERALERKAGLATVVRGLDDVTGVVSGPWPPYSFSGLE